MKHRNRGIVHTVVGIEQTTVQGHGPTKIASLSVISDVLVHKNGIARTTAFRFGKGQSEAVFNLYFNCRQDQKRVRQIHTLERVATLFLGLRHDAWNAPAASKIHQKTIETTVQKAERIVLNWKGPLLGVQILSNPKNGRALLRSRPESHSWNSFNAFPIVNEISTCTDTARLRHATKDIKTGSKLW